MSDRRSLAAPKNGDYVIVRATSASAGITMLATPLTIVDSLRVANELTRFDIPKEIDHSLPTALQFEAQPDLFVEQAVLQIDQQQEEQPKQNVN
jgi:hypothetical protein